MTITFKEKLNLICIEKGNAKINLKTWIFSDAENKLITIKNTAPKERNATADKILPGLGFVEKLIGCGALDLSELFCFTLDYKDVYIANKAMINFMAVIEYLYNKKEREREAKNNPLFEVKAKKGCRLVKHEKDAVINMLMDSRDHWMVILEKKRKPFNKGTCFSYKLNEEKNLLTVTILPVDENMDKIKGETIVYEKPVSIKDNYHTAETTPESVEPVAETTPEPVAESVEPVAETTPEPVAESVEPMIETIPEPVAEITAESVEPVPVAESTEPVAESVEPVAVTENKAEKKADDLSWINKIPMPSKEELAADMERRIMEGAERERERLRSEMTEEEKRNEIIYNILSHKYEFVKDENGKEHGVLKAENNDESKSENSEPVAVAESVEPVAETTPEPVAESISYGTPARIISGELTTAEKRAVARIMTEKICTVEDAENSYHLGYNNTLEITSKASGETAEKNFTIKIETIPEPVAESVEPVPVAESTEPVAEITAESVEPVAESVEPVPVAESTEPVAEGAEPVAESVAAIAEKIKIREFWDVWDRHKSCLSLTEKNAIITMLTTGVAYYKDAKALYEIRKIYEPKQCNGFAYELKVYEERQITRKGMDGKERKIFAGKMQKFEVNYPAEAFDRNGTLLEPMQKIRNKFFHTEWNRAREAADNGAALDVGQCLGELLREKSIIRLLDVAREYFPESIIINNENHIKANRVYYKGPHVIKAENPKAAELLKKKIAAERSELVFSREAYKAVNKLGEGILKEAALRPIWNAWKDIPDYHYTNSMTYNYGAREIKRLENRLKSIQKAQTKATENKPKKSEQAETAPIKDIASDWAEVWNKKATFGSVVFMEKTNGMRRLEAWWQFVPSKGRRIIMKSHNFKWDPNNKCWFVEWDGKTSPSLLKSYIDGLEESGMKIE